jgi:hypothetical protein
MGGLTGVPFESYNPYDPGGNDKIFTLDPLEPERRVGQRPGQQPPPGGLLGLLALALGVRAMRQSSAPNASNERKLLPIASPEKINEASLKNRRRVTTLSDAINGGTGATARNGTATINRAAQLAGFPSGGLSLGQRTQFPLLVAGADNFDLPAVLRGASIGQSENAARWPAPTNKLTRQERSPFHIPDDLSIPDFLRRTTEVKDKPQQEDEYRPRIIGDGVGGGNGGAGGGGSGGNDDDGCDDEIRKMREICIKAYGDGWNGNYTAWRSNYKVGPYRKRSGGRWTPQDCLKGLVSKRCGGEDPDDEENKKKHAWRPRPRRPRR